MGKLESALILALAPAVCGFDFVAEDPALHGMDAAALAALGSWSDGLSSANAVVVLRNDRVVFEQGDPDRRWQLKSATKSFGAGLLALALDDGVASLDDAVDPACGQPGMTLHDLASFSAGYEKNASGCGQALLFPPGDDWAYSDGSANFVRDHVADAYDVGSLQSTLANRILTPIGATGWVWDGRFSSGLEMDVRDMARYGRLWLRGGDWDGTPILSAQSVALATSPVVRQHRSDYGYMWWLAGMEPQPYQRYGFDLTPAFPADAPRDAFLAIGCTRSWILVVPSLDLVAARGGSGCVSIQGTPDLTDQSRAFVSHVLDAVWPACSDGLDNDGDGAIDFDGGASRGVSGHPADAQCADADGTREAYSGSRRCGSGFGLGMVLVLGWSLGLRLRGH